MLFTARCGLCASRGMVNATFDPQVVDLGRRVSWLEQGVVIPVREFVLNEHPLDLADNTR